MAVAAAIAIAESDNPPDIHCPDFRLQAATVQLQSAACSPLCARALATFTSLELNPNGASVRPSRTGAQCARSTHRLSYA